MLKQFKKEIEAMDLDTQDESEDVMTCPKDRMSAGRMFSNHKESGRMMGMLVTKDTGRMGRMSSSVQKTTPSTPSKEKYLAILSRKKKANKKAKDTKAKKVASVKKVTPKKGDKDDREIDNWIQCSGCYKWRRLPKDVKPSIYSKKPFLCKEFKKISCLTNEESWRRQYTTLAVRHN